MNNNYDLEKLPILLKRHHLIEHLGLSNNLYYKLLRGNQLPVIKMGKQKYVDRDKLMYMLNNGLIQTGDC